MIVRRKRCQKIWIQKNLSPLPEEIFIVREKSPFAQYQGTKNILIDDRPDNIIQWKEAGGIGIRYQANKDGIELIEKEPWDYVVDCIDTLSAKVDLIKGCIDRKLNIVSSMGAGGKQDPSQIRVTDLSKTYECNLARYVRKRLQALGIKKGLKVVFSSEKPDQGLKIAPKKTLGAYRN